MRARRRRPSRGAGWLCVVTLATAACGTSANQVDVPIAAPSATAPPTSIDDLSPSDSTLTAVEIATAPSSTELATPIVPSETTTAVPTTGPPSSAPDGTADPPANPALTTLPPPTVPVPAAPPVPRAPADPTYAATAAAFDRLARNNAAASLTVVSGGDIVYANAAGTTIDGQAATSDSPMVVASVSKFIVAIGIARLQALGLVDVAGPVPWVDLDLTPADGWTDVTIRDLLNHTSGVSKARSSWFTGEGSCRDYIPSLLTRAPNSHRGSWVYSNGNYCLLGLLIEQRIGAPLDEALQQLVFDPIGIDGVHLTDGGLQPGDVPHAPGVDRLSRLGGAGTLIVSTDDIALLVGRPTLDDLWVLQPPGVFTDQYGIGHTGTVDGAKSCVWLLDGGATVVSATIAGDSYSSGGGVCDLVVPAVATDLGINQGRPDRTP